MIAAVLAAGCAHVQPDGEAVVPVGARYVAMGSSFAAGPGLPPYRQDVPRCTRSERNYPSLLARQLELNLVDASCGGATTEHVLHGWNELPAQVAAVTADTRLVTVTIGGNDLGYVRGLVGSSCRAGAAGRPGPCWPTRKPSESDYARVEGNLRAIAREVFSRAPQARLFFVQNVIMLPPRPCSVAVFMPEDAAISRKVARRLADIIRRVAKETGSDVLPADVLSRDHTPCSREPWSVGMYAGYDGAQGASWHPNAAGMRAIAKALAHRLRNRPRP